MISHSRPWINKEDKTNILSVLQSELLISGKQVQSFRTNLQNISGFNEIRLTYSGQRAIELALSHIAVKTNKRDVILPTYVCSEVYEAILSMGFNPVLCDVGTNWIMTKETVQNHLDHNTAAIILISVFGIDVDANDFKDFDCFIINDLCQNFDDLIKKRSYYGDFITVSFHPTKCLTALSGGALISCIAGKYPLKLMDEGWNDVMGSLVNGQLARYSDFQKRRNKLATQYYKNLPKELSDKIYKLKSSHFRFPLWLEKGYDFKKAKKYFETYDIAIRKGVDELLHKKFKVKNRSYKNAETCFQNTLSIPIYPSLSMASCNKIVGVTKKYFREFYGI